MTGGEEERSKGENDEERRMRVEVVHFKWKGGDGRFLAMQVLEIPVVAP